MEPNQSPDQPNPRELELDKLYSQLNEVASAEDFLKSPGGSLWMEIAALEVTKATRDVTSSKYEKDHMGYLKRLAELQAYKNIIRRMQVAASPVRKQKIQEAIGVDEGGTAVSNT